MLHVSFFLGKNSTNGAEMAIQGLHDCETLASLSDGALVEILFKTGI